MESIYHQLTQLGELKLQLQQTLRSIDSKITELHNERFNGCQHEFSKPVPGYEHEGGHCLHCGINEVYYLSNKERFAK